MAGANENQMRRLANAMQGLAGTVNSENPRINIINLADACRLFVTARFGFSIAFASVELEISNKVNDVANGANINDTIESVVVRDMEIQGEQIDSVSRAVIRLMRIIEMVKIIIEETVANPGVESLVGPMSTAYGRIWGPFHGPIGREYFNFLMPLLPTLTGVLNALNNEDEEETVEESFRRYVESSEVVVDYIKRVFRANEASAEWLRLI